MGQLIYLLHYSYLEEGKERRYATTPVVVNDVLREPDKAYSITLSSMPGFRHEESEYIGTIGRSVVRPNI